MKSKMQLPNFNACHNVLAGYLACLIILNRKEKEIKLVCSTNPIGEGATNAGLLSMASTNLLLLHHFRKQRKCQKLLLIVSDLHFLTWIKKVNVEHRSMSQKKCKHDPRVRFDFPPRTHLTLTFPILYALHTLTHVSFTFYIAVWCACSLGT